MSSRVRVRRWARAVALLLACAATPAVAAPRSHTEPVALRHEIRRSATPALPAAASTATAEGLVAYSAQRLQAGLAPSADGAAAGEPLSSPGESFRGAGDLDGDSTGDILALRFGEEVTALRGTTGAALWTFGVQDPFSDMTAARTGTPAGDGALVLDLERTSAGISESVEYTFTALDGAGEVLWEAVVGGMVHGAAGAQLLVEHLPVGLSLADVDGDGATDVRLTQVSGALPAVAGTEATTFVISGADGTVGPTTEAVAIAALPVVERMPDLDGDGREEVALLDLSRDSSALTALDGRTGAVLWRTEGLQQYSLYVIDEYWVLVYEDVLTPLGDATSDGVEDLRVLQFDRSTEQMFAAVVDGRTGEVGFSADVIHPLGDVTGGPAAEIGVVRATRDGGAVTFRYEGVDFGGTPLRTTSRVVPVGEREQRYAWLLAIGDVDGDGIDDIEQDYLFGEPGDTVRDSVVLSGADISERWSPQAGWFHPSFDGKGTDHLTVATQSQETTLTARDGATGAPLWSTRTSSANIPLDYALDIDNNGRHELLVDGACIAPCNPAGARPLTLLDDKGAPVWERRR